MRQARHLPQRWYWSIVLQVRDVIHQFTQGTPNCNTNPKATVFGIPKEPVLESAELITSRLTGAGSLLPPVYGEAWAKGHATGTPDSTFPRYGSPHTANMRINNAICTCPAGGSPDFCEHVFAVLYAIEDYSCKEMYSTSTERLQTWHPPKPCKTLPLSSNQTFGKSQNETKKIKINEEFKWECLDNFNLPCTLALANRDEVKLNLTIGLPAAVCSKKVPINMPQLLLDEIVFFHKHYCNDISELLNIERQTTGQNCSVWRNHRKIRLTASDVKQIVARKSDFPAK
ncbi:SWIM-type domain-containing protein [Trichonephila clavipes]|nr:SWIM-type domain-containing protein [Trichonephila clavipes]